MFRWAVGQPRASPFFLFSYHPRSICLLPSYATDAQFDEDILDIIASHPTPPQPSTLADALCKAAQEASEETGSASPFMCRAIEEGLDFMGGKKDDISVLVAVVRNSDKGVVA